MLTSSKHSTSKQWPRCMLTSSSRSLLPSRPGATSPIRCPSPLLPLTIVSGGSILLRSQSLRLCHKENSFDGSHYSNERSPGASKEVSARHVALRQPTDLSLSLEIFRCGLWFCQLRLQAIVYSSDKSERNP